MRERISSRLGVDALEMAVSRRLPGEGLLTHSDRGSPYVSDPYPRLLERHAITWSMSCRANCGDNAPRESFFASLKKELVHDEDYEGAATASNLFSASRLPRKPPSWEEIAPCWALLEVAASIYPSINIAD